MLSLAQLRVLRWRSQRLAPRDRSGDPAAVVRAVAAIQSQEPDAAALALRARGSGFDVAGVERARVEDRSIVRTWCQRGTIHLVPTEDLGWMLRLLRPTLLAQRERRWRNLALDDQTYRKVLRTLRKALAHGPLSRGEIGERFLSAGIDASGNRLPHLISRAAIDGEVCDGPQRGRERTWVRLADWVEIPKGPEGKTAYAELARRYLAAHGPAGYADLAAWSGLKVGDTRAAWALVSDQLDELETEVGPRWMLGGRRGRRGGHDSPVVRLLAGFDGYLLGYRDRTESVPPPNTKAVSAGGLRVLPAVAIDGEVIGTWRLHRRPRRAEVEVHGFGALDPAIFEQEVRDVGRFLDLPTTMS